MRTETDEGEAGMKWQLEYHILKSIVFVFIGRAIFFFAQFSQTNQRRGVLCHWLRIRFWMLAPPRRSCTIILSTSLPHFHWYVSFIVGNFCFATFAFVVLIALLYICLISLHIFDISWEMSQNIVDGNAVCLLLTDL